jgi:hypothetical protein
MFTTFEITERNATKRTRAAVKKCLDLNSGAKLVLEASLCLKKQVALQYFLLQHPMSL